jgi:116 kDa U5 small nuclear ribonucleoprotein component
LEGVKKGAADGPLLINAVKMYHTKDYKTFYVLGRILSGTIKKNDKLRIMGENYISGDEEDLFVRNVKKLYLLQGRYRIEVLSAAAGTLVLMEGIDQAVTKTATITHADLPQGWEVDILVPLKFWSQPTIRIAIEPLIPSELPKMVEAIRLVNKSYLMLKTKVEESGEHVLIANG